MDLFEFFIELGVSRDKKEQLLGKLFRNLETLVSFLDFYQFFDELFLADFRKIISIRHIQ